MESVQEVVGMTTYEKIAIILSIIAILVPIVQWAWKKWIIKERVTFIPTGQAVLFFNQSGSYMRINGVIESNKKAITIRKVGIQIKRQKDHRMLNLSWSLLFSPMNQSFVGTNLQTTEAAHPFRVDADSIKCVFAEYTELYDSFGKTFRAKTQNLFALASEAPLRFGKYSDAVVPFSKTKEYESAIGLMKKEFYWEVGKYDLDVVVEYNNTKKIFKYEFTVSEQTYEELLRNCDEAVVVPLKNEYHIQRDFRFATVELDERGV